MGCRLLPLLHDCAAVGEPTVASAIHCMPGGSQQITQLKLTLTLAVQVSQVSAPVAYTCQPLLQVVLDQAVDLSVAHLPDSFATAALALLLRSAARNATADGAAEVVQSAIGCAAGL